MDTTKEDQIAPVPIAQPGDGGEGLSQRAEDALLSAEKTKPLAALACERLAAVATNVALMRKLKMSLQLLLHVIVRCGRNNSCVVCSRDITAQFGIGRGAYNEWLRNIEAAGLVKVAGRQGNDGVLVELVDEMMRPAGGGGLDQIRAELASAVALATAVQLTANSSLTELVARLEKAQEVTR